MSNQQTSPTDTDTVQQRISASRNRIAEDPCDLGARISLAWCLLFESICYRREQEGWADLSAKVNPGDEKLMEDLRAIRKESLGASPDHRRLLKESLMQASTVLQLSAEQRERDEAERIREMAGLFGSARIVAASDAEAQRILARISRAICAEKREKTRISSQNHHEDYDEFEDF